MLVTLNRNILIYKVLLGFKLVNMKKQNVGKEFNSIVKVAKFKKNKKNKF